MIFQPIHTKHPRGDYLAYVEPFQPTGEFICPAANGRDECIPDPSCGMYRVTRRLNGDGTRTGMIINLKDIWRQVELVPIFGKKCPRGWTSETSVEEASEFFVNHYFDKDIFASFVVN